MKKFEIVYVVENELWGFPEVFYTNVEAKNYEEMDIKISEKMKELKIEEDDIRSIYEI